MRTWVDDRRTDIPDSKKDKRWVMRCDRCDATSRPYAFQPHLTIFRSQGWFIAKLSGDLCPDCFALGAPEDTEPHHMMDRLSRGHGCAT